MISEGMLINLSNHPSSLWSSGQIKAAEQEFGKVKDIPFPVIDSSAGREEIIPVVIEYVSKCISLFEEHKSENNAVHIMGELTFTINIVKILKEKGIKCVASTTERNTKVSGNKKISEFNFVRFREY